MKKRYLADDERLMKDWSYDLNPGIDPSKISLGMKDEFMWKCHVCGENGLQKCVIKLETMDVNV